MEPPPESPAEQVTRLRDALNDLCGIMALPAVWTGGEPPRLVSTSLEALLGIAKELEERVLNGRANSPSPLKHCTKASAIRACSCTPFPVWSPS